MNGPPMLASERRSCNPLGLGMMVLLRSVEIPMGIVLHFTQVLSPETDMSRRKRNSPVVFSFTEIQTDGRNQLSDTIMNDSWQRTDGKKISIDFPGANIIHFPPGQGLFVRRLCAVLVCDLDCKIFCCANNFAVISHSSIVKVFYVCGSAG